MFYVIKAFLSCTLALEKSSWHGKSETISRLDCSAELILVKYLNQDYFLVDLNSIQFKNLVKIRSRLIENDFI